MRRLRTAAVAALALDACTAPPERIPAVRPAIEIAVAQFSRAVAGGEAPTGWEPWVVDIRKPATRYSLAEEDGQTALRADAQRSVSGLMTGMRVDPAVHPRVRWRWKVERLIPGADERRADGDDSPARLVIAFAGDYARLDPGERARLSLASALSGREAPYAMLMFIWSSEHAPETVIPNPRSSRVQMIVVEQGPARLGRWLEYERDVAADYRRAFGEDPGPITAVGVLTDADDTQSSALTHYGDILFRAKPPP
jgi:hypothetical protein